MSRRLFKACLQNAILSRIDWEIHRIDINGEHLAHFDFADDVIMIAHTPQELEKMLNDIHITSKPVLHLYHTETDGVSTLEPIATGNHTSSCICRKTAPSPPHDASRDTLIFLCGSKLLRTGSWVTTLSNWFHSWFPCHAVCASGTPLKDVVFLDKLGRNYRKKFTIPRYLWRSFLHREMAMPFSADTFTR